MIDVRELHEWEAGHIPDAQHIPLSILQGNTDIFIPPDAGKICVLYCQKGIRSRKAAELLLQAGFHDILSLKGGYEAWQATKKS
jgi:hydroxyacylglutathione hydrolase